MELQKQNIVLFLIISTILFLLMTAIIVIIVFINKRKQLLYLNELESIRSNFEKNLLSTRLEIQEETLQSMAREIHDNIGLTLTMAKLNLNTIPILANGAELPIRNSVDLISKAILDLSHLSRTLNAGFIADNGLIAALEMELEKIKRLRLFEIRFRVNGSPVFLDTQKELVVFRIIQEALNNSLKHARAHCISLELDYNASRLEIRVEDDGTGIAAEILSGKRTGKGSGLLNLKSRAALIQGSCKIFSEPGKGTRVLVAIPYNE